VLWQPHLFWRLKPPLPMLVEPLDCFFKRFPFFNVLSKYYQILGKKGPKTWETKLVCLLMIKNIYSRMVVKDSCVPGHISHVKKLPGLVDLGPGTATEYWGQSIKKCPSTHKLSYNLYRLYYWR